jgi:hypothetical protein
MAHNPHAPQSSPEQQYDPAGNTQMFQAFVDEAPAAQQQESGNRARLLGIAAVVAVSLVALVVIVLL